MTMLDLLRIFFELSLIFAGCYALYKEKSLIKLEKKIARYIKGFFKAVVYTMRDAVSKQKPQQQTKVSPIVNTEFEELLRSVNKPAEVKDVMIA